MILGPISPDPENSVNYNAISLQIIANVLPMVLPAATVDRHNALTMLLVKSFSRYFDPAAYLLSLS